MQKETDGVEPKQEEYTTGRSSACIGPNSAIPERQEPVLFRAAVAMTGKTSSCGMP
jgi:hypothetical protein